MNYSEVDYSESVAILVHREMDKGRLTEQPEQCWYSVLRSPLLLVVTPWQS